MTSKRFLAGFSVGIVVAVLLNLLPYLRTRSANIIDGYEIIGFPFTFRRTGGYEGIYDFHLLALLADIALGLLLALAFGYTRAKASRD